MSRTLLLLATAIAASTVLLPARAGDVYQWKDANGVVHYSQSPPASGAYVHRVIRDSGSDIAAATPAATPQPANPPAATAAGNAQDAQCARARQNTTTLQGSAPVTMDSDGDGKPDKTLTDAERVDQLALAQATVKANCGG